jgi:uncharacterized protein YfkK (UPF0435 family)
MTNEEIDRKCEIVENALYRLKDRDYVNANQVRAIDDFMAGAGAEALADLYDLIRYHAGPET